MLTTGLVPSAPRITQVQHAQGSVASGAIPPDLVSRTGHALTARTFLQEIAQCHPELVFVSGVPWSRNANPKEHASSALPLTRARVPIVASGVETAVLVRASAQFALVQPRQHVIECPHPVSGASMGQPAVRLAHVNAFLFRRSTALQFQHAGIRNNYFIHSPFSGSVILLENVGILQRSARAVEV